MSQTMAALFWAFQYVPQYSSAIVTLSYRVTNGSVEKNATGFNADMFCDRQEEAKTRWTVTLDPH